MRITTNLKPQSLNYKDGFIYNHTINKVNPTAAKLVWDTAAGGGPYD